MEAESSVKLIVSGKVQGVSFRWFTVQAAREYGLNGYAKNMNDGTVEVVAEGPKARLELLIEKVKQGPPFSSVDEVAVAWNNPTNQFSDFNILR